MKLVQLGFECVKEVPTGYTKYRRVCHDLSQGGLDQCVGAVVFQPSKRCQRKPGALTRFSRTETGSRFIKNQDRR